MASSNKVTSSNYEMVVTPDGEVREAHENISIKWPSEPQYVKLYLNDILYLQDLPKGHSTILYEIIKRTTWADNSEKGRQVFFANKYNKQNIATALQVSLPRINNVISDLGKGEILIPTEIRGAYTLNPMFFGIGNWAEIAKLRQDLKLTIDYNETGRTIMATIKERKKSSVIPGQVEFEASEQKESYEFPAKRERAAS